MTPARTLGLWTDYFDMANKLHIDLSDGMRLLPKDLKTAHDEAVKAVKVIENAETDKAIAVTAKRLEKWSWSRNGLLIRPARSYGELMTEGAALCHCVGRAGYAEKMARGETAIFFIRKEDEPETPLATLEIGLKSRKTIQCYGKNDRFPGEDVKRFYLQWEKQVVNGVPCQKKKTERRSA